MSAGRRAVMPGPVLAASAAFAALVLLQKITRAEPTSWAPGHRTASDLPGEVKPDDALDDGDGVYGRFQGRYDFGLSAGAEVGDGGASLAARLTAHYFSMAGVYAGYAEGFGSESLPSSRTLSFGVDLRPAFLPRWSNDMQRGPSVLDLTVDSISLAMGVFFREPQGQSFGDRKGFELSLGFGVPLVGEIAGPWLGARGNLRWDDPYGKDARNAEATALLTVGWHWVTEL